MSLNKGQQKVLHQTLWPLCKERKEKNRGQIYIFYENKQKIHLQINLKIICNFKTIHDFITYKHFWVIEFPWVWTRTPPLSPSHNKWAILGDSGYNGIRASSLCLSLWPWSKPTARPQKLSRTRKNKHSHINRRKERRGRYSAVEKGWEQ